MKDKAKEIKEQEETLAFMDKQVEEATDCGPVSHKTEKKAKEKVQQEETLAFMDQQVDEATDCGCK